MSSIEILRKLEKEEERLSRDLGLKTSQFGVNLTPNMDISLYKEKDCYLIHSLLHLFYHTGSKTLAKNDIEKLHKEVKPKINHTIFDDLDYEN